MQRSYSFGLGAEISKEDWNRSRDVAFYTRRWDLSTSEKPNLRNVAIGATPIGATPQQHLTREAAEVSASDGRRFEANETGNSSLRRTAPGPIPPGCQGFWVLGLRIQMVSTLRLDTNQKVDADGIPLATTRWLPL